LPQKPNSFSSTNKSSGNGFHFYFVLAAKKKKRTKNLSNAALHFLDYFPPTSFKTQFSLFSLENCIIPVYKKSLIFDDGHETHL